MSKQTAALEWLWHYRKFLLTEIVLLGLFELLYFFPLTLKWWVWATVAVSLFMSWWIANSQINKESLLFAAELLWVVLSGAGFLIFGLVGLWPAELVIGLILLISGWLIYWHQQHIDYQKWNLDAINWLGLINIFSLFVGTASLWLIMQFYNLSSAWLVIGVGLQLLLALYLLFWRQGLPEKKFWLYALALLVVAEELLWLVSAWHKSVYFKSFLLIMVYYLYSDFAIHYLRGNLTVKLIFEYLKIAIFLILILFIFDLLFLLVSNA